MPGPALSWNALGHRRHAVAQANDADQGGGRRRSRTGWGPGHRQLVERMGRVAGTGVGPPMAPRVQVRVGPALSAQLEDDVRAGGC